MLRIGLLILPALVLSTAALADTYSWVDDKGSVVFTDNPSSIPKKAKAKVRRKVDTVVSAQPIDVGTSAPAVHPQAKVEAKVADPDLSAMYGGKALGIWKNEFDLLRDEMKGLVAEMEKLREQIGAKMSLNRKEYIAAQKRLRIVESEALKQQDAIMKLKNEAAAVGVPLYVRGE